MDIRAFQYFESVCRNGSVARAARESGISAQGLSGSLRRLSEDVGAPLLVAKEGALELTEYGRVVLAYAREINTSHLAMRKELAALLAHNRNIVRLGSVIGALGYLDEAVFDEFNELGPGAQVFVVREATNSEVARALDDGECDMAILAEKPGRGIRAVELVRDCFFLWVKEGDVLADRDNVSLSDLEGRTLAIFDHEPDLSDSYASAVKAKSADVTIRFVGEVMRVFDLAFEGHAVGLTCRNHVEATRGSGVVGIPFNDFELTFYLCYNMMRELSPAESAFLSFMDTKRVRRGVLGRSSG